jgi:hypothetical protein
MFHHTEINAEDSALVEILGNYECPDLPRKPDVPRKWDSQYQWGQWDERWCGTRARSATGTTLRLSGPLTDGWAIARAVGRRDEYSRCVTGARDVGTQKRGGGGNTTVPFGIKIFGYGGTWP